VKLKPGEHRRIQFIVGPEQLAFYNRRLEWGVEPGEFRLMLGSASDDIRLETGLTVP